jgi:membrane-bound serine protease (ClpP class)
MRATFRVRMLFFAGKMPAVSRMRALARGGRRATVAAEMLICRPLLCFATLLASMLCIGAQPAAQPTPRPTTADAPSARKIPDAPASAPAPRAAEPASSSSSAAIAPSDLETAKEAVQPTPPAAPGGKTNVVVIPVREQVDSPLLFIIRRGLKEAIEQKADVVVLDMKTPGGALDVTFEIMEALGKFPGKTITYVNDQAISAGAFISATTDEIWFAPRGKIGAAAPVSATGEEIDRSMRQKVVSFLRAEVRAVSEGKGYRGQVVSAMIDEDYELKIGETVIKPKGELLTLTASEAVKTYGAPPQPLLGAGIASSLDELLTKKFGGGGFTVKQLEVTWSERFAVFLRSIAPFLMGIGVLALYIEFKTPGFGVFGITGIACLAVVFLSNYVAGLSGQEPMLVFCLGLLLVFVEFFFFPGVIVFALAGLGLMFGSLIWSMADIWPNEPITFTGDLLVTPLRDFALGMLIAVALALALARFIPRGWFFSRLAVASPISGSAQLAGAAPAVGASADRLIGERGVATTGLFPSGQVDIAGRRYEARLEVGSAPAGTPVVVRRRTDFGLIVDRDEGRPA